MLLTNHVLAKKVYEGLLTGQQHWELTTLVTKVVTTYLVVTTFKGL